MYIYIYTYIYIDIYKYIYIYIHIWINHMSVYMYVFLCFLQFPICHLPPCSSSQACPTMLLAPGLYLHGGVWMDGTWETCSMTRCISYTWGLWGISMQVRWDTGSEMVTMGMGQCLRNWGPFPKTWKINPAEKGPLGRFNVIIFVSFSCLFSYGKPFKSNQCLGESSKQCVRDGISIVAPYYCIFFPGQIPKLLKHAYDIFPGSFLRARPSHWRTRGWTSQTNTQKLALHSRQHLWKELCGSSPKLP